MMTTMLLAEPPTWVDELSAWSTFATAVLALVAGVGAVGTFVVAWKAYKKQRDAFEQQNTLFGEQIKQLEEDRQRRQKQDREEEKREHRTLLAQARQVMVKTGDIGMDDETVVMVSLINRSERENATSIYPAAYVRVTNRSASPIMNIESELGDVVPKYCWIPGRERLEYDPKAQLDYLPSGATAYFVHADIKEEDIPHFRTVVRFDDDAGNRWQTNDAGKTKLL